MEAEYDRVAKQPEYKFKSSKDKYDKLALQVKDQIKQFKNQNKELYEELLCIQIEIQKLQQVPAIEKSLKYIPTLKKMLENEKKKLKEALKNYKDVESSKSAE